jgi:hypothetical protein
MLLRRLNRQPFHRDYRYRPQLIYENKGIHMKKKYFV